MDGAGEGEETGKYRVILVFFDAEEEVLWRRIEDRRVNAEGRGRGADDAATVTRSTLSKYVRGFERPEGSEGAILVKIE